jgi:hypothetical protein
MAQWDSYSALSTLLGNLTLLVRDDGQASPTNEIRTVTDTQLLRFLMNASPVLLIPRHGQMLNGKISVSVSSNNLTLALKTSAGTDPSSTDKVYININGTVRTVTAATSCTLNAATNWFNAGGAELATKEVDYFAYAIWDSNSSVVAIAPARIPYGKLVSDFNSTSTNEKYIGNYANYTSTDDVAVLGRFAATLSAGAGYTWTVPTFTSSNLINMPIYETRLLSWAPAWTNLSVGNGTVAATYKILGARCYAVVGITFGSTTSISGGVDITFPITRVQTSLASLGSVLFTDTGTSAYNGDARYISASVLRILVRNASTTYETLNTISSTVPHTWASTDLIDTEFQYDIN